MVKTGSDHQVDRPTDGHQGRHQLQHDQRPEIGRADQALQEEVPCVAEAHLRPEAVSSAKRSQRGQLAL